LFVQLSTQWRDGVAIQDLLFRKAIPLTFSDCPGRLWKFRRAASNDRQGRICELTFREAE
jgi:hypothetical protein